MKNFVSFIISFSLLAHQALAAVYEDLQYDHYRVAVEADESLKQAINRATPVRKDGLVFHAHTRWNLTWRAQWDKVTENNCALKDVEVHLTTVMQLPRLIQAGAQHHKMFDDYNKRLMIHELGHHKIGREAAFAVEQYLLQRPHARDCQSLQEKIDKAFADIIEKYVELEADYDRTTRHGETQGALLSF